MLKSPSPNGDSLFSQVPPENAAQKKVSSDSSSSSCFDEEDSSTSALEIVQMSDKPTSYVNCVKNEPVDNSADLLLDDSLRLQIERSIEIVVNEFSLDSTSCTATSLATNETEVGDIGSKSEKLNQCVVDFSSATGSNDVNEPEEQPPAGSATTVDSVLDESASCVMETTMSVDTSLIPTTSSQSESVHYSNRSGMPNVKCEPRDATNLSQRSRSMKNADTVPSSHAPSTTSDICSNGSATGADVKPFSGSLRSSCLYSSAMKPSKDIEFALTPSVTMSSMTQPKVYGSAAPMHKMTNNVCQVSVKPISRSSQPPATSYAPHSMLLDGDPRKLGSTFIAPLSTFPDCCDTSKLNLSRSGQFASEPRYQFDAFSGCVIRKTEPSFSCSSSLTTSTSPSLSTSCFCTNSCYGKPCLQMALPNQLLNNSSLSQRALNLHNSYDLYPKGVTTSVPGSASQSFDYYRPKSSGPSCFRVPSSPISKYSVPPHLPAKEPLSPHMSSLSSYSNSTVGSDALGPKSLAFFSSTPPKSLKNWNGSTAAATAATAATACMLQNSTISPVPYKFQMPRIPSSPSTLPSSYIHSSPMTAPAPPQPVFPGFGDQSNISAPRLYNGGNATSLINASSANGLKSPQHQHPSVLQQYPFGSSLQKSQCCFPSQLQCYTNCCKEAQQQFSFV